MLAVADLITVLDSVASGVLAFENALGILGTENGTISKAAASNRDTLAALNDADVQKQVTPMFAVRASLITASVLYGALQGEMLARALDIHYGGIGSLNRFLTTNDARVHPLLKKIGFQIDARNTFVPTVLDPVARYEGTGAGTGTFEAGSIVDTSQYGEAAMQIVVEVMGASARNVRLFLTTFDTAEETRDVTIPANSIAGFTVAIGGAGDRWVGVTSITTLSGGLAGDEFRVRSIVERNLPPL